MEQVSLPDELIDSATSEANHAKRTMPDQLAHWVRLGRMVDSRIAANPSQIESFLSGELDLDSLNDVEKHLAFDAIFHRVAHRKKDGSFAKSLEASGHAYYEGDERFPDKVIRVQPGGTRGLGTFDNGSFRGHSQLDSA